MEDLTKHEIQYLIALSASEEAMLIEIIWEFKKWACEQEEVLENLSGLIKDNTILIYKHEGKEVLDLSREQSLNLVSEWIGLERRDHMLYLTDEGEKRWEVDDWGITTKRVRHLMFSNSGGN